MLRVCSRLNLLLQQGRHAQAADVCSRLLDAVADAWIEALQLLALARKGLGDVTEAERLLSVCVQLQPQRAEFHSNLANLLRASGRVADAEAAYRQALQVDGRFKPRAWV